MFSNKPMSRLDRDIDYLLPQDISDFAKDLGHDGGWFIESRPINGLWTSSGEISLRWSAFKMSIPCGTTYDVQG